MSSGTSPKQRSASAEGYSKRRNANAVLSLSQFAHSKSKGTRRAIETYRQKRQNKFNHRAGLVRGYRKALKSEGFESDGKRNGISNRKRNFETLEGIDNDLDVTENDVISDKATIDSDGHTNATINKGVHSEKNERKDMKRPKFDPFAKARAKAKRNKDAQVEHQEHMQTQLKVKEGKLKERAKRSKRMSKRTRRGQPIMKNVIGAMLGKLQEESKKE